MIGSGQMSASKIPETLRMFELEAHNLLKNTDADHVIYGWKESDDQGRIKEVHFYMLPLNDDDFYERTKKLGGIIYALHKL